uniref:Ribonuclease P/MRP subunit p30 n=1 Tax=Nothoprocta perdicaria TaxID=30464 RepID=A0A8C6ZWF8_NOTPE
MHRFTVPRLLLPRERPPRARFASHPAAPPGKAGRGRRRAGSSALPPPRRAAAGRPLAAPGGPRAGRTTRPRLPRSAPPRPAWPPSPTSTCRLPPTRGACRACWRPRRSVSAAGRDRDRFPRSPLGSGRGVSGFDALCCGLIRSTRQGGRPLCAAASTAGCRCAGLVRRDLLFRGWFAQCGFARRAPHVALSLPVGYSAVALNHVVDCKEKKQVSFDGPGFGTSKQIKVLNRLTLVVSDPSHCNLLRSTSTNLRLYDIIAVFPKTEKLFHAIDRGIYFELLYAPAIKDSTMRRYTISNAISLMQICKGKVSSRRGNQPLELRGPYDVANLALLFGMSERDAKAAVSTNCRATLLHGETRKSACGVVYTVKKPRKVEEEETTVPACKKAKTQA